MLRFRNGKELPPNKPTSLAASSIQTETTELTHVLKKFLPTFELNLKNLHEFGLK